MKDSILEFPDQLEWINPKTLLSSPAGDSLSVMERANKKQTAEKGLSLLARSGVSQLSHLAPSIKSSCSSLESCMFAVNIRMFV